MEQKNLLKSGVFGLTEHFVKETSRRHYFRLSYRECGAGGLGSSPIGSAKRGSGASYRYPSSSPGMAATGVATLLLCAAVVMVTNAART